MSRRYRMSKTARQSALDALAAAQKYISTGKDHPRHATMFICFALNRVDAYDRLPVVSAKALVMRSLDGHSTYEGWLHSTQPHTIRWGAHRIQMQRKRWVQHLVSELQKSLDTPKQKN